MNWPAMNWFGESWGAQVCLDGIQRPTPTGEPCLFCEEAIVVGDRGMFLPAVTDGAARLEPVHRECELRQVMGGIEHLLAPEGHRIGSCYDGTLLTYRESSIAVWKWIEHHGLSFPEFG